MKLFLNEIRNRGLWSIKQVLTIRHIIAMIIFTLMFGINGSEIPIEKTILTIVFIIFCTYQQLAIGIAISIFIGIIVGVFPFLGFLIPILILLGIISKLTFVWENKYAMYLGITVVLAPSQLIQLILGDIYRILAIPVNYIFEIVAKFEFIYTISDITSIPIEYVYYGILFNIMMISLYFMKYSVDGALTAICMLPLLFMSILVPAIISEISTLVSTAQYNNYVETNPGMHNVREYTRINSSGDIEHVKSHIRTNPDGIETNNLSYIGD